jgi:predicted nucleic acid-binding protein
MRAVDTNVLVRLITRDDPRQTASAERFIANGAWVSTLALAEATLFLRSLYQLSATELVTSLEMLLNHSSLVLQDPDVVSGALQLFRAKPSLGFTGCLMLETARRGRHLPLGTFDRKLARVAETEQL